MVMLMVLMIQPNMSFNVPQEQSPYRVFERHRFLSSRVVCDILVDISDRQARSQLEQTRGISWLISVIIELAHSWNKQKGYPG